MSDMSGAFPVDTGVAANFRLLQDVDGRLARAAGAGQDANLADQLGCNVPALGGHRTNELRQCRATSLGEGHGAGRGEGGGDRGSLGRREVQRR